MGRRCCDDRVNLPARKVKAMKTLSVKVQNDYLQRMCKVPKPIVAIEELIWNGLDADATKVRVRIQENRVGGLEAILISDNGHGLDYQTAIPAFENLGGSWKQSAQRTRNKEQASTLAWPSRQRSLSWLRSRFHCEVDDSVPGHLADP
jgi:hypothetical protein